ncbi:MAG: hypothetical protein HETSPECPRED_003593 [Heterodermia speciosa]|uniref:Uncharacterized protein n=1 Tax=Heterodermia speciosa TaxID=116794 RepID=A0A8H3ILA2_9LECA|nr:MAG: hypothetical protein HETSPECPRED_003593 [Heterodermia speciosa]
MSAGVVATMCAPEAKENAVAATGYDDCHTTSGWPWSRGAMIIKHEFGPTDEAETRPETRPEPQRWVL